MVFINFFTFIGILLSILGLFFLILGLDNYIPIVARMMFLGVFILGIFIIGLSSPLVLMSIKMLILESIGLFILNIFLIFIFSRYEVKKKFIKVFLIALRVLLGLLNIYLIFFSLINLIKAYFTVIGCV
ncbi:hypothetical protein GNF64_12940 [Clostridium perfringens]|uniref:Uncharacterized protein n=1 Tax=Clostridium perfringens TaxID=1502 RepID=A0AAW9J3V0_CLOPF|nr:hypothetical protein [Clostridium perfringens]MDZ4972462.1 hypothetical protein [Clostridium perfringens]MDZ5025390.1 hypothetical protein [Clostridium perfringens]MDZ5033458.1 hypothetical protein [Clostridium perfringens]MDZ5040810.1 hypothetical protein [Clostridium perfringens]